jgi:hypothetical protein
MAFDNVQPTNGLFFNIFIQNLSSNNSSFVPAMILAAGQRGRFNFGQDSNSLKFFTTCGLQEGYEPFCVYVF